MAEEELHETFDFAVFPSFEHKGASTGAAKSAAPASRIPHRLARRGSVRNMDLDMQTMLLSRSAAAMASNGAGASPSLQVVVQQLAHLQHQMNRIMAHLDAAGQHNPNNVTSFESTSSTLNATALQGYAGKGRGSHRQQQQQQALQRTRSGKDQSPLLGPHEGVASVGGDQQQDYSPHESSLPFAKINPLMPGPSDEGGARDDVVSSGDETVNLDETRTKMRTVSFFENNPSNENEESFGRSSSSARVSGGQFQQKAQKGMGTSARDDMSASLCSASPKHDYSATVDAESNFILLADSAYIFCTFLCSIVVVNMFRDPFHDLPASYYLALLGAAQLVFGAWMVSRTFLRFTINEWTIVDDLQQIRRNYFRTWLVPDLLLTIPFEFIFVGWANIVFRYLCARHFLRWVRLLFVNAPSSPLASPRPLFSFLFLTGFFCLVGHTFAMIYRSINSSASPDNNIDYVQALYFIVGTISSVGYADHDPANDNVRAFLVVVMGLGFCFLSSMTALATRFLAREDQVSAQMKERKVTMHSMMQHYGIPWELQREVVSVFPSVLHNENEQNFKNLIASLPTIVSDKVEKFLRTRLLKQMSIFRDLSAKWGVASEAALSDLAGVLQVKYYPSMINVLDLSDDAVEETFFVLLGHLQVVVWTPSASSNADGNDTVVEDVTSGGVYTQAAGVAECGGGIFTASACQLLVANSDELRTILRRHKVLHGILHVEAERQYQALLPFMATQAGAPPPSGT